MTRKTRIYVDEKPYDVRPETNLLEACLGAGLDIPYFCWHPALGAVGACRQCAVKMYRDEHDSRGRIVMSCMTPVKEGARISIEDKEVVEFRRSVIEWLMVNHPHDCPVCDEGGECHLQDMTVMTGHAYRRYRFPKRTNENQYLGPFVNHEMNRCIQCYRCVRYYREFAGGRDLDVFGCHDNLYFGRYDDGPLENEFSGNLVEICPTGVFTDKTPGDHYVRKWDFCSAPSVCPHCSIGCNTLAQERGQRLRRIRNRYSREVNTYFLCDRGRFGYGFNNSSRRIQQAGTRNFGKFVSLDPARILEDLEDVLRHGRLIGIGSPRASLESNYLLKALVGDKNFSSGMEQHEQELVALAVDCMNNGPAPAPSLREIAECDAVLILGEDVTNTAPMMALSLRQSVLQRPSSIAQGLGISRWDDRPFRTAIGSELGPLYQAVPCSTSLDDIARNTLRIAPHDIARLGFAVSETILGRTSGMSFPSELSDLAARISDDLLKARKPLVISGTQAGSLSVVKAAANVAWALRDKGRESFLGMALPECNSSGIVLLGGKSLDEIDESLNQDEESLLIVIENDLAIRGEIGRKLLKYASRTLVIEHTAGAASDRARFVLPAATYTESDGTLVNNEMRAQRFVRVFVPGEGIKSTCDWLKDLSDIRQGEGAKSFSNFSEITLALAESRPEFAPLRTIVPPAIAPISGQKIAREPHRFSGRTATAAHISVHEPRPPHDNDSPFSFSMEGFQGPLASGPAPFYWAPGWNSVQAVTKYRIASDDEDDRHADGAVKLAVTPAGTNMFGAPPSRPDISPPGFLAFRICRIFGSDYMSRMSPAIAEMTPPHFVAMNDDDAKEIGADEGDELSVTIKGVTVQLFLKLGLGTPRRSAGIFCPDQFDFFQDPVSCSIEKPGGGAA